MEATLPIMFAAVIGFNHAFEADHLIAISNLVTGRNRFVIAAKDGIYWGLGHSSTILAIGLFIILGKNAIDQQFFEKMEGVVGLLLVILGLYKLINARKHAVVKNSGESSHQVAYGIGLVHGLAGSGAVVILAMTQIEETVNSIVYLLLFGVGSILGMLLAAGIFSLPFSRKLRAASWIQVGLLWLSSGLCIGYGGWMIYQAIS